MENDVIYGPEIFETGKKKRFLKINPGEEKVVGIKSIRYDYVELGQNGKKPALIAKVDYADERLGEPVDFTVTAEYLVKQFQQYETNRDVNLFKWLFRIRREGSGLETRYTFTPHEKRL